MVIPTGLESILRIDPDIMHGKLCFAGTRVPLSIFLDNLAEGMGIDEFLENYPSVTREQVQAVVTWGNGILREAAGLDRAG
ncbi:MAG: DUF433 domain-containing protein [Armatimonadetes bacterium]|nr:DUF433 domain-containing protein [Armatimonadota bacterium]